MTLSERYHEIYGLYNVFWEERKKNIKDEVAQLEAINVELLEACKQATYFMEWEAEMDNPTYRLLKDVIAKANLDKTDISVASQDEA